MHLGVIACALLCWEVSIMMGMAVVVGRWYFPLSANRQLVTEYYHFKVRLNLKGARISMGRSSYGAFEAAIVITIMVIFVSVMNK